MQKAKALNNNSVSFMDDNVLNSFSNNSSHSNTNNSMPQAYLQMNQNQFNDNQAAATPNWDPVNNSSTTDSPLSNLMSEGTSEVIIKIFKII